MGTEGDQVYCKNWACHDMPSHHQDPQSVSILEVLDHGSISFGKYASESLAWEKFSVFTHNRCQEELEKFKAPGLVAQKKAYFEQYYKKLRAMKELQAQQQESAQSDAKISGTQVEDAVDAAELMEEKTCDVNQTHISTNETPANLRPLQAGTGDQTGHATRERESYCDGNNNGASMIAEIMIPVSHIGAECFVKEGSSPHAPSGKSSRTSLLHPCALDDLKHNADQAKNKAATSIKSKGTGASAAIKTKLDSRSTKDAVKPSEKPKPTVRRDASKTDKSQIASRKVTPNSAINVISNHVLSCRQLSEVSHSSTVQHTSRDKVVSSSSNGGQLKVHSAAKRLVEKLPTSLRVPAQSAQCSSENISVNTGLQKSARVNRNSNRVAQKSPELNSLLARLKGGESVNQRPKLMSRNTSAQNKSNNVTRDEAASRSLLKAIQQKKVIDKDKVIDVLGRGPKPPSSKPNSSTEAFPKLVPPSRPTEMKGVRKEPRQRMPSWR